MGACASDELDLAMEQAPPLRQRSLFLLQAGELLPEVVELTHGLRYPKTGTVETSSSPDLSADEVPASVLAMDASPVLDRVATLAAKDTPLVLVGIGGHGCAGKTTLARLIPDAQIVSTDGFWNGTEFELSRLRAEVLEPIMSGEPAEYRAFSWATAGAGAGAADGAARRRGRHRGRLRAAHPASGCLRPADLGGGAAGDAAWLGRSRVTARARVRSGRRNGCRARSGTSCVTIRSRSPTSSSTVPPVQGFSLN